MDNISYFKLQAKNLFHDFKLDFMQDDENYICAPRFFDINVVINAFDVDTDKFTLMKAQHIIALMVGATSWNELINTTDEDLEIKKNILENGKYKIKRQKIYNINLSQYEKIDEGKAGDYLLRCPRLKELEEIITHKPDCYFLSCSHIDINSLSDDMKHIYVNVLPHNSTLRVMVPGLKWPEWYAVSVKNKEQ